MALGPEIYARGFRFSPTPKEAVTYYLPRLVSGDPRVLPEVVRPVIHRAQVYACDPADLARRFRPMPRTHNRFFFTVSSKGVRVAGPGSWVGQSTVEVKDNKGVQIGELRKFRYKRRGGLTDWLMEEYSSCALDGAGGMQPVLCKLYVSPKAAPNSDAYKESAACFATPPPAVPAVITQPAAVSKRPAPPPPQDGMSPCAKRMRGSILQPAGGNVSLPPPPQPSALPAPTRPTLAAVQKMSFAPPQPCAPCRALTTRSATHPLPASAPPLAPPVAPRPALQPRGSAMPLPLPPPPRPLAQPKKQAPLTTTPVASASHVPQQALVPPPCPPQLPIQSEQRRTILDPFEAAMVRDRAEVEEEQTVAAAPATLQDDDDEELAKVIEDMLSDEAEEPAKPNSDAYRESAACFTAPPPAAAAVITQPVVAKRPAPAPAPQDAMPPCAKRMRPSAALPAPTRAPLAAVRKLPFAPPQPSCAPRRGSPIPSATQPSPASALPLAPAAPTRPPLAAVQEMSVAPPQPCAPCRGLTTRSATQPLPASAPPLAPPVPTRPALQPRGSAMPLPLAPPPRPLAQPKKQAPLTTTPVASGSHMPQQALVPPPCPPQLPIQSKQSRTILDPFEAAMVRDGAEVEEQTVAAAPATLQDDDDDFAKVMEDMLSEDEEEPALEFDVDAFFNFSEEDLEASMPASS